MILTISLWSPLNHKNFVLTNILSPTRLCTMLRSVVLVGVAALAVAAPATASTPGYVRFVCARAAAVPGTLAASRGRGRRLVCPCVFPQASHARRAEAHTRGAWVRSLHRRPPPVCLSQLAPGVLPDSLGAVSASANSLLQRCLMGQIGAAQSSLPSHRTRQADSFCESPPSSPHGPACRDLLTTVSPVLRIFQRFIALAAGESCFIAFAAVTAVVRMIAG